MKTYTAAPVAGAKNFRTTLGEGALWESESELLYFVDIDGQAVHSYDPESGKHHYKKTGNKVSTVVKRAGHKLLPMRSKVNAQHCIHMVLVDEFGFIHFPHIEGIAVSILVANHKVDGLVRVPADAGRLVLEEEFLERGVPIDVVEDDRSVHAG